jgi:hypothetical protein
MINKRHDQQTAKTERDQSDQKDWRLKAAESGLCDLCDLKKIGAWWSPTDERPDSRDLNRRRRRLLLPMAAADGNWLLMAADGCCRWLPMAADDHGMPTGPLPMAAADDDAQVDVADDDDGVAGGTPTSGFMMTPMMPPTATDGAWSFAMISGDPHPAILPP